MALDVAIVGAGPAGLYCAERLLRDGARVDVIERLPTPFGLVRSGVAPDHQGTKAVTRVFEKLMSRAEAAFFGNVEVGRDVTLAELNAAYDAVVLATGAPLDRRLGIPGGDLGNVFASGAFVGWVNGHPDFADAAPDLSGVRSVAVIGNGNVAIDVARLFAKSEAEMARSDLDPEIGRALAAAPIETVHILGRRGAGETGFSAAELSELGRLERAVPVVDPRDLPSDAAADTPTLKVLRDFAAERRTAPLRIVFHFRHAPRRFLGSGRVRGVACDGTEIPADLVVSCIGYRSAGCCSLAATDGIVANEAGRVADRLWVVGWAKRGPSGTIATNRSDSHEVAARLVAASAARGGGGRDRLEGILAARGAAVVRWSGWQAIDRHELAAGAARVRRKLRRRADLLAAAQGVRLV